MSEPDAGAPEPLNLREAIERVRGGPAPVPLYGSGPEIPRTASARERPTGWLEQGSGQWQPLNMQEIELDHFLLVELDHIAIEAHRAKRLFPARLNSHHEAWALLTEEVEEYWAEVKKKRTDRDPAVMRKELRQIAAVAILALVELGTEEGCRR